MSNDPRTKGRNVVESMLYLDQVLDALDAGTISPDAANSKAQQANIKLRHALGQIEHARARGEKPNVAFFATEKA